MFKKRSITILGSCRQDSLYRKFNVNAIKNELTYPHYSSEILQVLKLLNNELEVEELPTPFVFRSFVLNGRIGNVSSLRKSFISSDLVAIEIASRISYLYKGFYLHHICEDKEYDFTDKENLIIRDLTDEEIENDIKIIIDKISPRRIFLITHFYSRNTGKRYELVKLIKKIGEKYNIPVFDPVEQIGGIENLKKLTIDEPVLSHYNDNGHEVILNYYTEFLRKNFNYHKDYRIILKNKIKEYINRKINKIQK